MRFCLSAEGKASGCDLVTISMFSYAVWAHMYVRLLSQADMWRARTTRGFNVPTLLAGHIKLPILREIEEGAAVGAE